MTSSRAGFGTGPVSYISVEKDAGDFKIGVFTIIAIGLHVGQPPVRWNTFIMAQNSNNTLSRTDNSFVFISTLESGGILVFLEHIIDVIG